MNDERRPARNAAATYITATHTSKHGGMQGVAPPSPRTPLQVWTSSLFDLLDDARGQLDERAWPAFVSIACDRIGILAARLVLAEVLRAGRQEQDERRGAA